MQISKTLALVAAALLGAALIGGCASTYGGQGVKAAEGIAQVREGLAKGQRNIDDVLTAMDGLAPNNTLKPQFNTFRIELKELQDAALKARQRARAMQDNSKGYMERWEKEAAEIQDPNMRASSEERRKAVHSHYASVAEAAQAVRDAYQPFLTNLTDIEKTLSLDLSPGALPAIEPARGQARHNGAMLKQRINALSAALDKMQSGV